MNAEYPQIVLKRGREGSLRRHHPWVFSGALLKSDKEVKNESLVSVYSEAGDYLATGFFFDGNIAIKAISFKNQPIDRAFWSDSFRAALALRQKLGLVGSKETTAFRFFHGEGDGVPGLVIDLYGTSAVIQFQNPALRALKDEIKEALLSLTELKLSSIYVKGSSRETADNQSQFATENFHLHGTELNGEVLENNLRFAVDWEHGQKTGFFLDQRENRLLLSRYSKGKRVLNCFCYTGGFSVYALNGGAAEVHSVDSSLPALELAAKNGELNFANPNHELVEEDCFRLLENIDGEYDVIVLDPPAFAKHRSAIRSATKGYQSINTNAIRQIRPGGIIFTFSCSQWIDRNAFHDIIQQAAVVARRKVQILHQLHQAPCHPVSIFHPEGEYLKGLVLSVGESF